jgi:hypothetical protein
MKPNIPARRTNRSEEGYLLVWVMFMLAVFTLWLSVAVPRAAKEIQRDRELETMNRGKQYVRAVQLYYRKFHRYPPNANALVNTNDIHFLRKKYLDPTTGKDDWKPIRFGQAKTQATGFFGQPIAGAGSAGGSVLAGTGPSGNSGIGGSSFGSSATGSTFGGSSIFGSSNTPGSTSNSGTSTATGASPTTGTGMGAAGASGTPGTTSASGANGNASSTSAFGSSDQTFGGAGIVGFSPASTKSSILILKKKQHYNEWEFVYDPLTDTRTQSGNIGQPASSTSTPVGSSSFGSSFGSGSGSGFGSGSGSSFGSGSGGGFGSTPTAPAPPPAPAPQPQQ